MLKRQLFKLGREGFGVLEEGVDRCLGVSEGGNLGGGLVPGGRLGGHGLWRPSVGRRGRDDLRRRLVLGTRDSRRGLGP